MSPRRNRVAVLALAGLLLMAAPLVGSLLSDLLAPEGPPVAATPTLPRLAFATATFLPAPTATLGPTPTSTLTATATATNTATATSTSTPTNTPTNTPTPTSTPSPTPRPRVYLLPFVQVFAVGQPQPKNSAQVLMYEGGTDVFEVLERQGTFTRLQTPDGGMNFWTETNNVSAGLPPAAQYDYSVRGRTGTLLPGGLFACAHNDRPTLAFGTCQTLNGITSVTLVARITAGSTSLYLAQLGGAQYLIPTNSVVGIS